MLLAGLGAGGGIGAAVWEADPGQLSEWFIAGCAGAGLCLAAALLTWRRWQQRNMLIAAAGWFIAATFVATTIWPLITAFSLYVFYFVLFTRRHEHRN